MFRRTRTRSLKTWTTVSIATLATILPAPFALAATEDSGLDEIVVKGQRYAQQRAIEHKRESSNIVDALAADDIGRLPDRNIGDALSRLPGVSTDQFEGEARFITIRGLDSSLNNLTLDGFTITTDDNRGRDGRSAALDGISTSGIAIIEVAKTLTPDMDGTGIGGAVNLITPSAFDRPAGSYGISADTSYSELSDNDTLDWSNVELFGSTVFGANDQFGIFVSADRLQRDLLVNDDIESIRRAEPGGLPLRFEVNRLPTKRERINLATNLQWRFGAGNELYVRGRYGENDRDITDRATQDFRVRDQPTSQEGNLVFVPLRLTAENEERRQRNKSYHVQFGGRLAPTETIELEASLAYSESEARRPLWSKIRARTGNFPGIVELGDTPSMRPVDPTFIDDPGNFELNRVRIDGNDNNEEVLVPEFDATWQTLFNGNTLTLKAGVKASYRDKKVDGTSDRFEPIDSVTLADIPNSTFPGPGEAGSSHGDDFLFGPDTVSLALDWPVLFDYFEANRDSFQFQEISSLANGVEDDYESEEDVVAGYLMAQLETGRALWTGGLRVEATDFDTLGFRFSEFDDGTNSIDPITGSNSYTDYLLNFQVRYNFADNIVARAAFTQSIGRPDFSRAAPIQSFETFEVGVDGNGDVILEGDFSTGNPDLDRFESDNFDLALEYYPSETGLFAASLFWKEINNPIFDSRQVLEDTTFDGIELRRLEIESFENAESGRVRGIELTAQEQLRFLPAPFDNFGVSANYTLVDSESDVLGRPDELPFFGQADTIANFNLFYQQEGFEGRVAWRYRDETLAAVGGNIDQDIYRDSFQQLDLKFGYRFGNGLFVFADIWNVTNEEADAVQGTARELFNRQDTGRWYTFGLQWSNF